MRRITLLLIVLLVGVTGCGGPSQSVTATPGMNATQAYQTVVARLTEIAAENAPSASADAATPQPPAQTPTPTNTPASALPSPSSSQAAPTEEETPCDMAAAGNPIDVSIPDDSEFDPGEPFTKIWRLRNVGTCTWTSQYTVVWFSGDRFTIRDAFNLSGPVAPEQTIDIAVDMTAPEDPGTYQSNWKLRNENGSIFSIGPKGDSSFWVRIIVRELTTPTPTPTVPTPTPTSTVTETPTTTPTAQATPTPTATPEIEISAEVSLSVNARLDLRTGLIDGPAGNDLLYSLDVNNNHQLSPLDGAVIGFFGASKPAPAACKAANLSSATITLESFPLGSYLCYLTNEGLYGSLLVREINADTQVVLLQFTTWRLQP